MRTKIVIRHPGFFALFCCLPANSHAQDLDPEDDLAEVIDPHFSPARGGTRPAMPCNDDQKAILVSGHPMTLKTSRRREATV